MSRLAACILLVSMLLAACSSQVPTWRSKVAPLVEELGRQAAPRLFPQEYRNLLETFEHGEAVLHVKADDKVADAYYQLAYQKAELLLTELRRLKQRQAEDERLRREARAAEERLRREARAAEEERLIREAAEAEFRLREQKRVLAADAARKEAAAQKKVVPRELPLQLPAAYTVRRGETLPQISGRSEIYNDSSLWPLIYRANRDQIRDPKRLWPGQVLSIPRHFSLDDALEARRYSSKK